MQNKKKLNKINKKKKENPETNFLKSDDIFLLENSIYFDHKKMYFYGQRDVELFKVFFHYIHMQTWGI